MPINVLKMKSKKSQIKMMETIGVLLVFLVLITFVLIFYIKMSKAIEPKAMDERANLKSVETAHYSSDMPELQCSSKNIITEGCIDTLRLRTFEQFFGEGGSEINSTYFDRLGNSRVTVSEIYPGARSWLVYERKPEGPAEERVIYVPVLLHDPITTKDAFGLMNVTLYS